MAQQSVESVVVILCQESKLAWVGAFEIPSLQSLPLTVSPMGSLPTDYADALSESVMWFRHRLGMNIQKAFLRLNRHSMSHICHLAFVIDNTLGEDIQITQATANHLVQMFINPTSSLHVLGVSFDEFFKNPTEPKLLAGELPEQFALHLKEQIARLIELTHEPDQWKIV